MKDNKLTKLAPWLLSGFILAAALWHGNAKAATEGYCEQVHSLAQSIMTVRQQGVSAVKAMKLAKDSDLAKAMIKEAYGSSRYSSDKYQERVVSEFANDWYMVCLSQKED